MLSSRLRSLCVALALSSASLSGAESLVVRADSWMPFNGEPTSTTPGYVVELLNRIFTPGVTVDYGLQPWTETLAAVEAGKVDAAIGANATEARNLVLPKEEVGVPRMGLFVLKDIEWRYDNLASLRQVKLAVIEGYSYWESLDEYITRADNRRVMKISGNTPLDDCIRNLDAKKVDVLVETFPVFVWAVKNSGRAVADYRVAFKQEGEPIYVAFAPTEKGRALAQQFDQGVQALRASGELLTILKRYGLSDWKE